MKRLIRNLLCSTILFTGMAAAADNPSELPAANRDLHILSLLGLGILGGGVVFAMRTRDHRR